jgi:hypothetical protein
MIESRGGGRSYEVFPAPDANTAERAGGIAVFFLFLPAALANDIIFFPWSVLLFDYFVNDKLL